MAFFSHAFAADTTQTVAADNATLGQVPSAEGMMSQSLLMLLLLFVIFYFLLIRPQQKKFKEHQTLIQGLQKGQKVITTGGMLGTIVKFEGNDLVQIEVAQGVKVMVARSSVAELAKAGAPATGIANDN